MSWKKTFYHRWHILSQLQGVSAAGEDLHQCPPFTKIGQIIYHNKYIFKFFLKNKDIFYEKKNF